MATVLAYTSPALGNLYPMAAVLTEMHKRGHRIVVKTLADGMETARSLGFEASQIDPRIEALTMTDWQASNPRQALKVAFGIFGQRGVYEVDDVNTAISAERPDAVLVDVNCWGAAAVAETKSLPWSIFCPFTPYLQSRKVPPFGPGLRPWPGLLGRLRDNAVRPLITGALNRAMLVPLNEIRAQVGADAVRSADAFLRTAPLVLVATAEPLEYPHPDWPGSVVLIGPCDFDPPTDNPPWLGEIERPIVLVTTSSDRQADSELPIVAMEALADEPVHVVATYPSGVPDDLAVAANATVVGFAPHGLILERAVCAITHGGMGATQKALARGVPVCVVPHGRDQFEVARRVEVSDCGTRLPAAKLTPARLRTKVLEAMSKTTGPKRVAQGFAAAGGVRRGADLMEHRLLGRSSEA